MSNLLKETITVLEQNGKNTSDVLWCGGSDFYFSWEDFEKIADVEYNRGFGSQKVASDLVVVGNGFWLERAEYDGSEWWEFKTMLEKPQKHHVPQFITTVQAGKCGWETLISLNELENENE